MNKRAEERALEAYPTQDMYSSLLDGSNRLKREVFIKGYSQAEKDLALTWEDMRRIIHIDEEMMDDPEVHPEWKEEQPYYEEVLRRFNKAKEEQK